MHQIHNNENDYCWQKVGASGTLLINSNSGRRRLNIIGALNPLTKRVTSFLSEANCDQDLMKVFLKEVRKDYRKAKEIIIYLDNASYNRGKEVSERAKSLGITLKHLPSYSPNLNLIERLWRFFKKKVVKNFYHKDFETFFKGVCYFFWNIKEYQEELENLLTLNFEIIKTR